jgi:hypothetical protein
LQRGIRLQRTWVIDPIIGEYASCGWMLPRLRLTASGPGVAALGAIFQQRITTSLSTSVGTNAAALGRVVSSAGLKAAAHGRTRTADAAHVAFIAGLHAILVIATIAVALGATAAVLVRSKDFHRPTAPVPPTEPTPLVATQAR